MTDQTQGHPPIIISSKRIHVYMYVCIAFLSLHDAMVIINGKVFLLLLNIYTYIRILIDNIFAFQMVDVYVFLLIYSQRYKWCNLLFTEQMGRQFSVTKDALQRPDYPSLIGTSYHIMCSFESYNHFYNLRFEAMYVFISCCTVTSSLIFLFSCIL